MTTRKVWCPSKGEMVSVEGDILQLVNALQELHIRQCHAEPECTMKHSLDCLVGKKLQGGTW